MFKTTKKITESCLITIRPRKTSNIIMTTSAFLFYESLLSSLLWRVLKKNENVEKTSVAKMFYIELRSFKKFDFGLLFC